MNNRLKWMNRRLKSWWVRLWMPFAGLGRLGRCAGWFAALATPPYFGRVYLAGVNPKGFISPKAIIHHDDLRLGANTYLDDYVIVYRDWEGGYVELGDAVHIHRESIIQTGFGGCVVVGPHTHIQPRCQFSAYKGCIRIGSGVEIAPNCAFYPYNHGMESGKPIREQPLNTRGGITVGDGAWLGFGVIVLDGAKIGRGAVIGAGSVVVGEIPDGTIAVGVPCRGVKARGE